MSPFVPSTHIQKETVSSLAFWSCWKLAGWLWAVLILGPVSQHKADTFTWYGRKFDMGLKLLRSLRMSLSLRAWMSLYKHMHVLCGIKHHAKSHKSNLWPDGEIMRAWREGTVVSQQEKIRGTRSLLIPKPPRFGSRRKRWLWLESLTLSSMHDRKCLGQSELDEIIFVSSGKWRHVLQSSL